ncbi:MAG: hypothetical protein AAF734_10880, partial [Bacteroidota bacterium]
MRSAYLFLPTLLIVWLALRPLSPLTSSSVASQLQEQEVFNPLDEQILTAPVADERVSVKRPTVKHTFTTKDLTKLATVQP